MSAITSITAQNTYQVTKIIDLDPEMVVEQIRVCVEDIGVDGIKTGMLHNKETIIAVSQELSNLKAPIVVDPVMVAKSGAKLLEDEAIEALKKYLIPISTVLTPNAKEAEALTGQPVTDLTSQRKAAKMLADLGARAIVVKGGHISGSEVVDLLYVDDEYYEYRSKRLSDKTTHGTGCVFASAIAAELAKGSNIKDAVLTAKNFVADAIRFGLELGKGVGPVNPVWTVYRQSSLYKAIESVRRAVELLEQFDNAGRLSPESMINIAEAIPNAQDIMDIVGIPGRIAKVGNRLKATSCPSPGGSRHVANAVLTLSSINPSIRAAMNIAYSETLIELAQKIGLSISSYDRREEPEDIKKKEGMTIIWGVRRAYESVGRITDLIYHKGDWGKEPMILITGRNAEEVVEKFSKLLNEYTRITQCQE
jgi:hydroxymethylpyrimidine kinase/phosphomethylpyrimidine kinase